VRRVVQQEAQVEDLPLPVVGRCNGHALRIRLAIDNPVADVRTRRPGAATYIIAF
jgi:hypothetical protein